jgi:hypothetical protein
LLLSAFCSADPRTTMEHRGRDDFGEATEACVQYHIEPGKGLYKPPTNSGLSLAAWPMPYGLWSMVYGI